MMLKSGLMVSVFFLPMFNDGYKGNGMAISRIAVSTANIKTAKQAHYTMERFLVAYLVGQSGGEMPLPVDFQLPLYALVVFSAITPFVLCNC